MFLFCVLKIFFKKIIIFILNLYCIFVFLNYYPNSSEFLDFSLTGMMGSGLELWPKRRDNEGAKFVSKGNTVQLQPLTKRPSPRN